MGASVKPAARRNARQFALQAIYSWQITKENVATIEEQFLTSGKYDEEEHR
ncbi:N utilization substance protein B, partial [Vibrio cholerae]|nr:N utilization substance protein B [Vibrio cholerae]